MTPAGPRAPLFLSAGLAGTEALSDPARAIAVARLADAARLDLLVFGESAPGDPLPRFDPMVVASWLAPHAGGVGLVPFTAALETEPFHVARALSALDFLTGGRSGWQPGTGGRNALRLGPAAAIDADHALPKARDFVAATRSLWDSWDADALVIDAASGVYLDPDRVRPANYAGPYFKVRGPLNAARPPQGHPVLVQTDRDPLWREVDADVLITEAGPPAERAATASATSTRGPLRAARFGPSNWNAAGLETLARQVAAGALDGLHLVLRDPLVELPRFSAEVLPELEKRGLLGTPDRRATLRARLGLATPTPTPGSHPGSQDGAHAGARA
jgi:alkanesulfonate monooxygenase SsuD/methylene tetrahydromethanopterin reductase-like flavin-dependent oxidoreductase (luciferase family)